MNNQPQSIEQPDNAAQRDKWYNNPPQKERKSKKDSSAPVCILVKFLDPFPKSPWQEKCYCPYHTVADEHPAPARNLQDPFNRYVDIHGWNLHCRVIVGQLLERGDFVWVNVAPRAVFHTSPLSTRKS